MVVLGGAATRNSYGVEVPLGVGVMSKPRPLIGFGAELSVRFCPTWYRIRSPVNEDPKGGVVQPLRLMGSQAISVLRYRWSIHHSATSKGAESDALLQLTLQEGHDEKGRDDRHGHGGHHGSPVRASLS